MNNIRIYHLSYVKMKTVVEEMCTNIKIILVIIMSTACDEMCIVSNIICELFLQSLFNFSRVCFFASLNT